MRKLSKPWPPADVSPTGQQQRSFAQAENAYRAALPDEVAPVTFARSEFDRLEKTKLRAVMYVEQRSLCIFCERRIEEVSPLPRIDHWTLNMNDILGSRAVARYSSAMILV